MPATITDRTPRVGAGSASTGLHFELGVRNLQGLVANFYAAERDVVQAMEQAAVRAAELVRDVTMATCAVDTTFMQQHVRIWYTLSGLGFEVGWDASDFFDAGLAFYPWFVEFGTRHMAAQPALIPAHEYVVPIYMADVADVVRVAIERRRAA